MPENNYSQETFMKHLYDYNFFIEYMLHKKMHIIELFAFFLLLSFFLKIGCANFDAAPIRILILNLGKAIFMSLINTDFTMN